MATTSRAEFLVAGKKLSAAYQINAASLPGLETLHGEFVILLAELENLGILQDAQTGAVQQTTKEIEDRLTRARLIATRLKNGVKLHLGTRTEKVIEFGIRPYRKRTRPSEPPEKPIEKPIKTKEAATETTATQNPAS